MTHDVSTNKILLRLRVPVAFGYFMTRIDFSRDRARQNLFLLQRCFAAFLKSESRAEARET